MGLQGEEDPVIRVVEETPVEEKDPRSFSETDVTSIDCRESAHLYHTKSTQGRESALTTTVRTRSAILCTGVGG